MVFIKGREKGKKRFAFVTSRGGLNNLRVHAAQYDPAKVEDVLKNLRERNPGWEFKSVEKGD